VALASIAVASLGGAWWVTVRSSRAPAPTPAPRGTLEWALRLLDAPVDELLTCAGDFERVVARNPRDRRLEVVARRILDLAIAAEVTYADAAAACAVRSLEVLGEFDAVRARAAAIRARSDLTRARREVDYVLTARRGGGG
jgi:hypothetical protein